MFVLPVAVNTIGLLFFADAPDSGWGIIFWTFWVWLATALGCGYWLAARKESSLKSMVGRSLLYSMLVGVSTLVLMVLGCSVTNMLSYNTPFV